MTKQQRSAFIKGTLILTAASIAIRVLGAVYRIPLAYILKDRGLGIYAIPSQIYWFSFLLSTAGLPVGISQVIASKVAAGRPREALRVFRLMRRVLMIGGALASLALFFGARGMVNAGIIADPDAYLGVLAIAPVAFFAATASAYRGLFAGMQSMAPIAFSQLADQTLNVTGTLLFSFLFLRWGVKYAAAGGNLGSVPGAVAGLIVLLTYYALWTRRGWFEPKALVDEDKGPEGEGEDSWTLVRRVFGVAIPVSFSSIAISLVGIIDSVLVIGMLRKVGVERATATALYGQLNQMALPFVNTTVSLASAMAISLVPALATEAVSGSRERLQSLTAQALDFTFLLAAPAAVGLYVLSTPLMAGIFHHPQAGNVLAAMSWVAITWSLSIVTSAALQGVRRAGFAMWSLVAGLVLKVLLSYLLIPTALGVRGSGYSTMAGFALTATLNFIRLVNLGVARPSAMARGLAPAGASVLMGIIVYFTYAGVHSLLGGVWSALLAAIIAGVAVYGYLVLAFGILSPDLLVHIPRVGGRLQGLARRLRLR